MDRIRPCRDDEHNAIAAIVNHAAEAYRGAIPDECWHEPYMDLAELQGEIAAGVSFWGCESDGVLVGVMGSQPMRDVVLIRHAYVLPTSQRRGIGGALLTRLRELTTRPMLVGTWAAASWAVDFYQRHAFVLVPEDRKVALLHSYWTVPDRQIAASVVLESPARA